MGAFSKGAAPSRFGPRPDVAPADNLALGRPYTLSSWPNYRRLRRSPHPPDYATALTDGRFAERDPDYDNVIFGRSDTALVFAGSSEVDVVVDLGSVQPIAGIHTRHDATANTTFLPRREHYLVSTDGSTFHEVATYENRRDPAERRIGEGRDGRKAYFRGVALYSSGPLRAAGRYVLVRTQASGVRGGRANSSYVGHDEIVVERGRFDPASVPAPTGPGVQRAQREIGEDVLGWRLRPPGWFDLFDEGPLRIGLSPHAFYGDDAYHVSVGGVYVLTFRGLSARPLVLSDVEIEIDLPPGIEVLTHRKTWSLAKPQLLEPGGGGGLRHTLRFAGGKGKGKGKGKPGRAAEPGRKARRLDLDDKDVPYLVVAADGSRRGSLGPATYRYRYVADGTAFTSGDHDFEIVVEGPIVAPAPRRFATSVWIPKRSRGFADFEAPMRRLLGFHRETGFNTIRALPDARLPPLLEDLDLTYVGITAIARNAYEFDAVGPGDWEEDPARRFRFHPKVRKVREGGACPTVMASKAFRPLLDAASERTLAVVDHARVNFEPYVFQKRGCICDRCKASYRQRTGLSREEVDRLWPDVVVSRSPEHDRFASWQLGQVVAAVQASLRRVGARLGKPDADLVPAISYRDFDPSDRAHAIKDPGEYLPALDQLVAWNFPSAVTGGAFDRLRHAGSNLRALPNYRNALEAVQAEQARRGTPHVPALTSSSGVFYGGEFRLGYPRDFHFSMILTFLMGFEGHTSYHDPGVDARYARLRARAHRVAATYEDWVFDGRPFERFRVTPEVALPRLSGEHGPRRELLFSRGFEHEGRVLLAIGNDDLVSAFLRLRVTGVPSEVVHWVDVIEGRVHSGAAGVSPEAIEREGLLVEVPAKSFVLLEGRDSLDGLEALRIVEPAGVRAAMDAARGSRALRAARLEAADARAHR